jgi:ribulose-5-phosphate 4-epimerase/fuculose-1-phosphate aldolase
MSATAASDAPKEGVPRPRAGRACGVQASAALHAVAHDLVAANRVLAGLGVLDGFGHVSARHPDHPDRYLLSRSCAPEAVGLDDIMTFDLWSCPLDGDDRTPYLERFIHGRIYAARLDVGAVVHSHAPAVVPFAASSVALAPVYHMSSFLGRGAPLFEMRDHFAMTDLLVRSNEQGTRLADAMAQSAVVLMRGHGFCAVGRDVPEAVFRAHYTRQNADVQQRAIALGGDVTYLDARECALATETNRQVMARPWGSWKARFAADV